MRRIINNFFADFLCLSTIFLDYFLISNVKVFQISELAEKIVGRKWGVKDDGKMLSYAPRAERSSWNAILVGVAIASCRQVLPWTFVSIVCCPLAPAPPLNNLKKVWFRTAAYLEQWGACGELQSEGCLHCWANNSGANSTNSIGSSIFLVLKFLSPH